MRNIAAAAMLAAFTVTASGCVSSGATALKEEDAETIKSKLAEGMTQDEVRANLGDPTTISYTDSGFEIWNYTFMEGQMTASSFIPVVSMFSSGTKGKQKQLIVLFNEDNTVRKYTMSSSDVETKTGIVRQ